MSATAKHSFSYGDYFNKLFIHGKLGEGAMGAAYLASHPTLRIPLVIKTFKDAGKADILLEAQLAARINCPQVVPVIDAGIEAGIPFIVQRYVDGIDLSEMVARLQHIGWVLTTSRVSRIIIDAARGLHAAHQAGVIHRDVKPANLFLCGNGVTVVGDFGLAADTVQFTDAASISGTPSFMAPEQWGQQGVERPADIYALGITAHLLATGRLPFQVNTIQELKAAHLSTPYERPHRNNHKDAYFFSVVEQMLRKNPSERFANAEIVADALSLIAEPNLPFVRVAEDNFRIGPVNIELKVGDLAQETADVIVNAANSFLIMNVGVAKVLRENGGEIIQAEALKSAPASMGDVVWTTAGKLKADWVAHAVAAIDGAICLQRCILRTLFGAEERQAASIALPALGMGVGQVPPDLAAKLTLEAIQTFAYYQPQKVKSLKIVLFHEAGRERWRNIAHSMSLREDTAPLPITSLSSATESSEADTIY